MALAGDDKSGLFLIDKELGGMAGPATAAANAT
jgi:ferritin